MSEKQKIPVSARPRARRESLVGARILAGVRDYGRIRRGHRTPRATSGPAVSIFGSARIAARPSLLRLTEDIARQLSDAGLQRDLRRRPGHHGSGEQGRLCRPLAFGRAQHPAAARTVSNHYQDVSQTFRHFFARKVMFVKFACAYVVMPGGFGTLDELMEALTLVQTRKIRRIPVILVQSSVLARPDRLDAATAWSAEGMIDADDMNLIQVIDEPAEVVEAIFDHYEKRGFDPAAAEREAQLNL